MRATIVTMFYNIRKNDSTIDCQTNRQPAKYLELAETFVLSLPYPIIVFLDEEDTLTLEFVRSVRERHGFLHLTHIYKYRWREPIFIKILKP